MYLFTVVLFFSSPLSSHDEDNSTTIERERERDRRGARQNAKLSALCALKISHIFFLIVHI